MQAPDRHPLRSMACAFGRLAWREAGPGSAAQALVLLHGIGSGSASWAAQLDAFSPTQRVIAWDAPGYGGSDCLPNPQPLANDYAAALLVLLQALGIKHCVLVGHSLGAIVAAAAHSRLNVQTLVLASPARGYGLAAPEVRAQKWQERMNLVQRLGVQGMAEQRAAHLCAPGASADVIAQVQQNMALVTPQGYAQAAHMLAFDDLLGHLQGATVSTTVLCGALDRVTPPAACQQLAQAINAPFIALHGVAHACYVEDPAQFNAALLSCLQPQASHV